MQTQFTNGIRRNPSWRLGLLALFIALLTWVALPQVAWAATFTVTKPADTNDGACNADCSLREAIIAANAAPGADVITLPAGTYTLSRTGVDNSAANGDLDVTGPLTINGAGQGTTIIQAGSSGPTAIDRVFSFNPLGSATGFAVALNNLTIRNGKNPNAFATQENDGGCFDFDGGTTGAGSLSLTNVTVSNCETTDGSGGGAALFLPKGGTITFSGATIQNNIASRGGTNFGDGGGLIFSCVQSGGTATVTITNSTISGNSTRSLGGNNGGSGGGIVNFGVCTPGTATANMLLRAVTISNNSTGADGGGIFSGGALTIDNVGGPSVISNNSAGRSGGGIWLNHPNTTSTISKVTFSGNSAGDDGGAIRLGSSTPGNVLNVSFSRFVNNTASSGKASGLSVYNGNATATNNWWGCSTGPSAAPCDTAKLDPATGTTGPLGTGTINFAPWLRVNVTAATNPLVTGQSTGLSASILTDSNGVAVALSNLTLLLGQPVAWSGVGGTISGQQTTIQANGTATANYQATAATAGNQAVAKVDNDGTTTGSNVRSLTVNKANTTATITADTPDPSLFGQVVTVNYNVTVNSPGAGTPTGNVTVSDGVNSCTGTVAAGTCTIALSTVGARTLTATYAGDANFNGSTSAGAAHTVNKANTTTTITSDNPDPSVVGQAVTVAFAVSASAPGAGTPTGNVTVSDGTSSCTATVAVGQCNLTFTSVGAKTLTATYAGDANFNGSTSASAAHTVNKADTTTTITADTPDPSTVGQAVTVSFNVVASAPGIGSPTGNVTVSDGVDSCTGTVAAGSCTITLSSYGNHSLTATYAGDANFNGSTSADEPHIVNQNDTTTVITADTPDPSVVGQTVIVQYTVTPGTATGNVAVTSDDGVDSCTGTVAAGQCTLTFTSAGEALIATYVGDDNFFPSASDAVAHTVNPAATTTTITADTPDPSTVSQAVTVQFAVQVAAPGAGTPTGNVTVSDGLDSCTATVAAGQCDITLNTTGARTLTATYAGDSNFNGSTSAGADHTVITPPTATPTDTPTNTPVPPTATPTDTPTNTPVPPTATPTNTPVPPTATPTDTPTNTPVPPTDTPTNTPVPPTATPTNTPIPPTATPTDTPMPPTATPTPGGTLVGVCGQYTVYQNGTTYSAAGWSGAIKVGTNGNNTLTGGSGSDLMLGLGGNDLLRGNGGDDVLCGGDGVDLLLGHAGNDYLDGGAGNDVLNGGSGDYDELLAGDDNDVLLDGDGVVDAQGGAGDDLFTLALRNGWRDEAGQARFAGLSGGYGNDAVGLAILNPVPFFVDISGDGPSGLPDEPPSPLEGDNDGLVLTGVIDPASILIKFEQQLVISATAEVEIPDEEDGAEYLSEPVGEESEGGSLDHQLFLPLVTH